MPARKNLHEPRIDGMLNRLAPGDRLIVGELTRLGRSLGQAIRILDELGKRKSRFTAIKEGIHFEGKPELHTKVMVALFGLFAKVERDVSPSAPSRAWPQPVPKAARSDDRKAHWEKRAPDRKEEEIGILLQKQVTKASIVKIVGVHPPHHSPLHRDAEAGAGSLEPENNWQSNNSNEEYPMSRKNPGYFLVTLILLFCVSLIEPKAFAQDSGAYPSLSGAYRSSSQHPRVFVTPAELTDMVTRINAPGSFSAQNFSRLANQVKAHLAANVDWDAVYSGCDLDIYLHTFSYEPATGYANEVRTGSQMSTAMNVRQGMLPPAGDAIVASRLALYAALLKGGAKAPAGAPDAGQAAALAKRILLAWASRSFRDQSGNFLNRAEQFCDAQQRFNRLEENNVGLQIARGVIYSVHAQDLLQSIGAFDSAQTSQLNVFHNAIFNLIREASNFRFTLPELNRSADTRCELYSNHVGAHLEGLLAIARLLDDSQKFNAVLYGNDRSIPVALPWTVWFNHAVYGENDSRLRVTKTKAPIGPQVLTPSRPRLLLLEKLRIAIETTTPPKGLAIHWVSWRASTAWRTSWRTPGSKATAIAELASNPSRWQLSIMLVMANMLASRSLSLPIMPAPVPIISNMLDKS